MMGILDELFRRKPEDEFLPEYAKPADPLRKLRDAIPENKDGGLSMLNMIRSALGTSANWLDATKDPSLIGPEEMVSPLGLGTMGLGMANALARASPDHRIAQQLARQHPEESAVGTIPRYAPLRDASNPTSAAHVYDYGMLPGASRPANVMADNAKGSAPGTVVNSLDMSEAARMQRAREMGFDTEQVAYRGLTRPYDPDKAGYYQMFTSSPYEAGEYAMKNPLGEPSVVPAYLRLGRALDVDAQEANFRNVFTGKLPDDVRAKVGESATIDEIAHAARGAGYDSVRVRNVYDNITDEKPAPISAGSRPSMSDDDLLAALGVDVKPIPKGAPRFDMQEEFRRAPVNIDVVFDPSRIRSPFAAFDPSKRDSAMLLAADNAKGSAPGTVVNSMAEGASKARTLGDEFLGMGTDQTKFLPALDSLKLSKAEWDELANHYRNAPTGSTHQFKFDSIDKAKKFLRDTFIERHSAESKAARIKEMFGDKVWAAADERAGVKPPGESQASPLASAPGLAANSTQQPKDASQLSEPMLMELLRRLEGGA